MPLCESTFFDIYFFFNGEFIRLPFLWTVLNFLCDSSPAVVNIHPELPALQESDVVSLDNKMHYLLKFHSTYYSHCVLRTGPSMYLNMPFTHYE